MIFVCNYSILGKVGFSPQSKTFLSDVLRALAATEAQLGALVSKSRSMCCNSK